MKKRKNLFLIGLVIILMAALIACDVVDEFMGNEDSGEGSLSVQFLLDGQSMQELADTWDYYSLLQITPPLNEKTVFESDRAGLLKLVDVPEGSYTLGLAFMESLPGVSVTIK